MLIGVLRSTGAAKPSDVFAGISASFGFLGNTGGGARFSEDWEVAGSEFFLRIWGAREAGEGLSDGAFILMRIGAFADAGTRAGVALELASP